MRKKYLKKIITALLISTILIQGSTISKSEANKKINITRVSGSNRYETSVLASRVTHKNTANNAVIVSGESEADGLSGGILATLLDGPVFLTAKNYLPPIVENRIKELNIKNIKILGGENTITKDVENKLSTLAKVERIAGEHRHETATKVAEVSIKLDTISKQKFVGIANAYNWPDSLAASGYLANYKFPLLLTDAKSLYGKANDFLKKNNIVKTILMGGELSVPEEIFNGKEISLARYNGPDRYLTSLNIAKNGFDNPRSVIITSGQQYEDALSSAPMSNYIQGPIILASKNKISPEILDYIINSKTIDKVIIVGGESVLPDIIFKDIAPGRIPQEVGHPDDKPVG